MICENSFFLRILRRPSSWRAVFLVYIPMKKQLYESPEAEVLEIELEYRLLGYEQIDPTDEDDFGIL